MAWILDQLDAARSGALVFLTFSLAGFFVVFVIDAVVHALVPDQVRARAAGTAAWVLSVLATIYAVLAAFVIVDEYGQLQDTQQAVSDQAAALSTLSENSRAFPAREGEDVRHAALIYAQTVVDDGFPRLADGGKASHRVDADLEALFAAVQSVEPETRSQIAFYDATVDALDRVVQTRSTVINASRETVPRALFGILVINGITILVVASLLDTRHRRSHLFILGACALVIALSLALVVSLDGPFDGIVPVNDAPIADFVSSRVER